MRIFINKSFILVSTACIIATNGCGSRRKNTLIVQTGITANPAPARAPTIAHITDKSSASNSSLNNIEVTINDDDSTLTCENNLTAVSSNTVLLPNTNIVVGGAAPACVISLTPASNQSGTSEITLTATDGSLTAQDTFTFTVTPVTPVLSYTGAIGTTGNLGIALTVTPTTLNNGGAPITSCTASPSLPAWASLNANTCVITGTPTGTLTSATYTITAGNAVGNTDAQITLSASPLVTPITPANLKLTANTIPSVIGGSIYGVRIVNNKSFYATLVSGGSSGVGRTNAGTTTVAYSAAPTTDVRSIFPFRGNNSESYIFVGAGSANNTFRRYSFSMTNEVSAALPFASTGSHGVDWVDDNTLIFSGYETGTRNRLHLVTVTPNPFAISANTLWNTNGYVTSAATRIRDVRVGRFFSSYAYYGNALTTYPTTAGVYALNLATGVETKIMDLTNLNSEIFSVIESNGYLFVLTSGSSASGAGIFVYRLANATTIADSLSGSLQTPYYTKATLDAVANTTGLNYAFDVADDLSTMALGYTNARIAQFVSQ